MSSRLRTSRLGLAGLGFALAALAALWLAAPVLAASAPATAPAPSLADDFSAADQYVESVPTAGGPKVPGVGKSRHGAKSDGSAGLSPAVKSTLGRNPNRTATQLERIATSPDYGAPAERLRKVDLDASAGVPRATVSAAGNGEEDTLTWLIVALIATTLLTSGTAAYRRYQSRNSAG